MRQGKFDGRFHRTNEEEEEEHTEEEKNCTQNKFEEK